MNLSRYISERWFWITLYALMLLWLGYLWVIDPGPRPTDWVAPASTDGDR